ncbi:MAG TPA: sugar phosphate isomerase/epimerase [Vicinamibacterales bacterium]|nr:sugar phosphate isomerase/epimerase [Vicinamibacterales bacterium]
MSGLTRREFGGVMAGGLLAAPFVRVGATQKAASSKIAGVRVGTQSYSFRDRSLDEALAGMVAVGLSYCELWSGHTERGITALPGGNRREATRAWRLDPKTLDFFKTIRGKFEAAGVTLTSYDLPFADDFTDEEIAAVFELGKALGVNIITSSAQVSVAPRVEPFAAKANMLVGFHNHSRVAANQFARPADFARAMAAGPHLGITLDIGHFTAAGFDAYTFLQDNHDHIRCLHIKDRNKPSSATPEPATTPFGQGEAPIIGVLKLLRDHKWDIPALIEYEYRGQDTVEEMKKMLAYCRTALTE